MSRHPVLLIALVTFLAAAVGSPIASAVESSFAARQNLANSYAPLLRPPPTSRFVKADGLCAGNSPCYTTIQAAINASSAGDTINVFAGTYAEEITIDRALTLLGPNAGINPNTGARVAEAVIVPTFSDPLNGGFAGPQVVTLASAGVTFNGFTIDGDNPSLNSGVNYNGADVDAEFGLYGPGNIANPDAVILNNIVKNIGEFGVWIDAGNAAGARDAVSQIANNKVDNCFGQFGQGIRIDNDAWVSVLNNVVTRVRNGIVIENYGAVTLTTHPASVIGNNNVTSFRIGIRQNLHEAYSPPGFTISNNIVSSYVQSVRPPQVTAIEIPPTAYQSIRMESIRGADVATVSGNTLTGNRAALSAAGYTRVEGLYVTNASSQSPNISFDHNQVTDFIRGVFNEAPVVPTFTCNLFQLNTTGVYLSTGATVGLVANNNNIYSNGFGMQNDGPATVNAKQNWWGAANGPGPPAGPGSGDGVSTRVDFSNFLTSAAGCAPSTNLAITKTHSGNFKQADTGKTYTITVSNIGQIVSSGGVTVTDNLPVGLIARSLTGTGWTCSSIPPGGTAGPATLSCTRSDAVAANGGTYPAITLTVDVSCTAPASVTNTATVSGGGDISPGNNTVNDPTTINPDTTRPSIVCPGSITRFTDPGQFTAKINPGTPVAADNCGPPAVTGVRSDGKPLSAPYPVGATIITWTARDGNGNTASCTQSIVVMVPSDDRRLPGEEESLLVGIQFLIDCFVTFG